MENPKCPKCKCKLEWFDTTDSEGGIEESYLIETSVWGCNKCGQEYVIQERALLTDTQIIYFRKN